MTPPLFLQIVAWTAFAIGALALILTTWDFRRISRFPIVSLLVDRFRRPDDGSWIAVALIGGMALAVAPVAVYGTLGWARLAPVAVRLTPFVEAALVTLLLRLFLASSQELIYRGALLPQIAARFGTSTAVLASSAVFAAASFAARPLEMETIVAVLTAFVEGIIFALLFLITRSLWVAVVWHASHDFFIWLFGVRGSLRFGQGLFRLDYVAAHVWGERAWETAIADLMIAVAVALALLFFAREEIERSRRRLEREWKRQTGEMKMEG